MKADDAHPLLVRWLEAQSRVRTWSADLVQTRTLKTVARPLTSRGHIWFAAPNRFRWELGEPPQTIAVREAAEMVVLYPRLKRAERYPLANLSSGPMKDLLTLIEAGFPRSQSELESQFLVLGVEEREGMGEIRLQPKSAMARKFMPELRIIVDRENLHPRATEMRFADGSTMRNDFSNPKINQSIEDATFHATIPVDFKTVEPMRKELGK